MTNRRNTPSNVQSLARWALPLVAVTLVACGGGEAAGPTANSSTPVVSLAPYTSPVTTSSLGYSVFGRASVATGSAATAEITSSDAAPITIAFPVSGAFPTGLVIGGVNLPIPIWNGVPENGIVPNMDWLSGVGSGILKKGNFFVFCSAGRSPSVSDPVAQAGAQVAISDNFVPMNDITPIIGKTFYRFDCTSTAATTTTFGGMSDVSAAFSTTGYQPVGGVTYKRKAYQINLNGQMKYVVVALDTAAGTSTASVLYQ